MSLLLPTDAELVDCAAQTYGSAEPFFEDIDRAIRIFLTKRADGLNILAIEGTHDTVGWLTDFIAIAINDQQGMDHATLGFIHAGFYEAAVTSLTRCALVAANGPYAICGHSLGAALALLIGALLSQDVFNDRTLAPVKIGAFAPPRVGGDAFVKVVTKVPLCAYKFGNDPVPEVPINLPWLPYAQVPLRLVGKPMINPIHCHAIANYVTAVHAAEEGKNGSGTDHR